MSDRTMATIQTDRPEESAVSLVVVVGKLARPDRTFYDAANRFLHERLNLALNDPEELARVVEKEMLEGLSYLNRFHADGFATASRRAGGGKLTKGS